MLIMFDYGHGGKDPGAVYKGRKEAQDVLKLGQVVAKRLRAAGIVVDETRIADATLSLDGRVKSELKKKYDYFISFHRNAFKPEQATGAEVYVYRAYNTKSKALARKIQKSLVDIGFRDRGVKEADFYVLKHTKAPALLLEVGFIDNSIDNELFDVKFEAIAKGIADAILDVAGSGSTVKKGNTCPSCGQRIS